jgi:hypothetical protein
MKIDKLCPQRINGFSRVVATHFEKNTDSKVNCPTSFATGLGLFYSTFATNTYTLKTDLIPACDTTKLSSPCVTACPAEHFSIKTGGATAAD